MKRIPAIALALLMLLQILPAAAETPAASGWQQVVSDSVTLSKSTTPFDYSDAGAYVRVSISGTYRKNQTPAAGRNTAIGGAVLEAWTVGNIKKQTALTLTAVVTALPEDGALDAWTVMNGALGARVGTDLAVGDTVQFDLTSKGPEGIALVRAEVTPVELADIDALWANEHLYLTGKLPAKGIVDAQPVAVDIEGEDVLSAYDIRIYGNASQQRKGKTWQPAGKKVRVHFHGENFADKSLHVYHLQDVQAEPEFVDIVQAEDGWVSFDAAGFSIYAVGEKQDDVNKRVGYRFWYNDGNENILLSTQYFRHKDVHPSDGSIPMQLYQPTIPGMDAATWNRIFKGWSKTADIQDSTPLHSITDLNAELNGLADTGYNETVQDLYASLQNVYYVTYVDINPNNVLLVELVPKEAAGDTTFTVKTAAELRPTIDSDTELLGWHLLEDPEHHYTPGQAGVVLDKDMTLYPSIEGGHWLVFDDNDLVENEDGEMVSGGASFTPPAFYLNRATEAPADPTWDGYEFGGWYTDRACTTPFVFGNELPVDTTVYAKWTPAASAYRVIIWKQRSTDAVGLPDSQKNYDYVDSYLYEDVVTGQTVTLPNSYKNIYGTNGTSNDTDKSYFVYNAGKTDQQTIVKANGSSVLNVYYDRKPVTLNFYIWDYGYTPTTANSGTQYGLLEDGSYVQLTRNGNTWTYVSGTETVYSVSSSKSSGYYYIPDGHGGYEEIYLYRNNNRWYRNRTGFIIYNYSDEYTGNVYTRTESNINSTYDGTRYTRNNSRSWRIYKTFTGLYGSSLEENEYTWPTEYNWYENGGNNGSTSGTRTTFMSSFLPTDNQLTVNFYGSDPSTSGNRVNFHTQKLDGTYQLEDYIFTGSGNPTFSISDKYNGYHASEYSTDGGNTWTKLYEKDSSGYYARSISYRTLDIRFDRNEYTLTFYTNNGSNQLIENILKYEAPLSGYSGQTPGQRTGHYFLGWFADPGCTQPFDFNQTMPDHNIAVYGKWKMERYRVVIEPGADNVYMGSQARSFRLDYDERIDGGLLTTATRAGYLLDGWYTDPSFSPESRFLFTNPVNANTRGMDMTYQTGANWAAVRAAYGDDAPDRDNVRGILHLYAKWIPDPNSQGYNVIYDAGDAALRDDLGNLLTTVPIDTTMYAFSDSATAIAREAPANYNDLYTFSHWEATTEDGRTLVIQPSENIPLSQLTAVETVIDEATGEPLRKTVKLTAIYTTAAEGRLTHITYDGNGFTEHRYVGGDVDVHGRTMDGTERESVTLSKEVNETIILPGADYFYLDGYRMVGWSFDEGETQTKHFDLEQDVAADNLDSDRPTDQNTRRNTLYAMWEPKTYIATIRQVVESGVPVTSFDYGYATGVENQIDSASAAAQTLTGNTSFQVSDQLHYYTLHGDVVEVTPPPIPADAPYDVRVHAIVTRDDGTREILQPTSAGLYQILGDVEIIYTYSPKVLVQLRKRDAAKHSTVLTDSVFVMTPVEFSTETQRYEIAGDGKTVAIDADTKQLRLQEGTYQLTETTPPDGYAAIRESLYLTIHRDESLRFELFDASGTAVTASVAELDTATGRILTLYDRPIRTVTVVKQVTGGFGDRSRSFDFTVRATEANDYVTGTGLTLQSDGSWGFRLKHGESIDITVLRGDTLTLTEKTDADAIYYTTAWSAGASSDPRTAVLTVSDDQTVTVTNHRDPVSPTGVVLRVAPYALMLGAGVALLILGLRHRKRRREDDEA